MKLGWPVLIFCALSVARPAKAVEFFDGDMKLNDWTIFDAFSWGTGSSTGLSITQELSGGHPGAYRRIESSLQGGYRNFQAHILNVAVWNPGSSAIHSLDFYWDSLILGSNLNGIWLPPSPPEAGSGMGQALVRQNGSVYVTLRELGLARWSWSTQEGIGFKAVDFFKVANAASGFSLDHPDFSPSGSPVEFGFYEGAGLNGGTSTKIVGYDNFRVRVNTVPEPLSIAALGVGLAWPKRKRIVQSVTNWRKQDQ